jgi:subtilase family serine protease
MHFRHHAMSVAGRREGGSRFRLSAPVWAVSATAVLATGVLAVGASGPAQASPRPAGTVLAGSAATFTGHTRVIGDLAAGTSLTIQVWLRPDVGAAAQFATQVSTPGSPLYRHYLSPAAYTARFGPSQAAASRVEAWLRTQGFTGIAADSGRTYVRATASAARIDATFGTQLKLYQSSASVNAGSHALRANDSALRLPAALAGSVLGLTGLDNAAPILPLDRESTGADVHAAGHKAPTAACSQYYGQVMAAGLPRQFGTTTFPTEACGYTADQMRAAYGANITNVGTGVTVALVEQGLTKDMFLTLQDYAKANSMPAPSPQRYAELSLGKDSCGDPFDGEEQLDVESAYDMAPGASQLVVGGDSCDNGDYGLQGLFDADVAVLDGASGHPLASIASNSWEGGAESQPYQLTDIEHAYLVRAAAEGVGMYFSAGDGSGVGTPSSDPYATAVGGTTLGLGQTDNRLFETGWSTGISVLNNTAWQFEGEQGASGGGPSLLWRQPSYQKGVVPPALSRVAGNRGVGPVRSVPDISADADPFTGIGLGVLSFPKGGGNPIYGESDIGGTSLASPLVAGIVAAAQQGQTLPFGFINPLLYKLYGTDAYNDSLPLTAASPALYRGTYCEAATCGANALTTFDDQNHTMIGYTGQVALKGYDNMTGVGTPNGQDFITALRSAG